MKILTLLGLCILCIGYSQAQEEEGRVLSLFNVVRFQNDQCKGSTMNGTCYTKQECKDRGGTESGNCAEGFGVCCLISLSCGGSSHDNNTYLVKSSVTAGTTCSYQICPASSKICRIRYDFKTHTLAANAVATAQTKPTAKLGNSGSAGDCVSDTFSIANMGGDNPPVICGTNDGQHMILDTDGQNCQDALFTIGSDTHTRKWDIHVTQYTCEEMETSMGAGPSGCLQYHTGKVGHIASFAFPVTASLTGTTKIGATATHLNNQDYKICFRKESGITKLCFTDIPASSLSASDQGTYGLSVSPDFGKGQSGHDTDCVTDYLEFSGGVYGGKSSTNGCGSTSATTGACTAASTAPKVPTKDAFTKLCGRYFTVTSSSGISSSSTHETVCSLSSPYEVRVHFDGFENQGVLKGSTASGTATSRIGCLATVSKADLAHCESDIGSTTGPSGTIGFGLIWHQY